MVYGVKEKPYNVGDHLDFIPNYEIKKVVNSDGSESEEVHPLSVEEYRKRNLLSCVSDGVVISGAASPDYLTKFQMIDELEKRVSNLEVTNKKTD